MALATGDRALSDWHRRLAPIRSITLPVMWLRNTQIDTGRLPPMPLQAMPAPPAGR